MRGRGCICGTQAAWRVQSVVIDVLILLLMKNEYSENVMHMWCAKRPILKR